MYPTIPLGVPQMDADHAAIERLFARVPDTRDADLPALFAEIEAEVIAHFAREEVLMEAADVPVLPCHRGQHALLLDQIAAHRPGDGPVDPAALRRTFSVLAECVEGHVASVDRITSQFLRGALDPADVLKLRLPETAG